MPQNKDLKRLVRTRMAETGENYTQALARVRALEAGERLDRLPPAWQLVERDDQRAEKREERRGAVRQLLARGKPREQRKQEQGVESRSDRILVVAGLACCRDGMP